MGCAACGRKYRGRTQARVRSSANASGKLAPSSTSTSVATNTSSGNLEEMPSSSGSLASSTEETEESGD